MGFPGGSEVEASACNEGELGSILGSGRSPGEGNGNHVGTVVLQADTRGSKRSEKV